MDYATLHNRARELQLELLGERDRLHRQHLAGGDVCLIAFGMLCAVIFGLAQAAVILKQLSEHGPVAKGKENEPG